MAGYVRYTEDFISHLLDTVDICELVGKDVSLRQAGASYKGRCPFHEERTASFVVSPVRQTYKCFGCHAKGDAIEWLKQHHRLPFQEAVAQLASGAGVALPKPASEDPHASAKRALSLAIAEALSEASEQYKGILTTHQAAKRYLGVKRQISQEVLEGFEIGAVGEGILSRLVKWPREILLQSGIAVAGDNGLFDRFRQRIMLPIRDEGGRIVGFGARSLIERPDRTAKYLNSPDSDLFKKGRELYGLHIARDTVRASRAAVVVEGYFDVVSLHQAGETRAVSPMGTAITPDQVKKLFRHADAIYFAFDGDQPGRLAALKAARIFLQEMTDGKTCYFVFVPEGEDPDSLVRRAGHRAWCDLLETATPLSALMADYVSLDLDRGSPESQMVAATKARAVIGHVRHAELYRRALQSKLEATIGLALH